MHRLTHSVFSRLVATAIVVVFAASAFGPLISTVGAQEEETGGTTFKVVPVAVLDFVNRTSYPAPNLGRNAADAMVIALDESQRYDPEERSRVEREMALQGFTVPLSDTAQSRLGKALQVAGVISGEIRQVRFLQSKEGRYAEVVLAVRLLDVNAMEPVNGAMVRVSGTPKPGYSGDEQVLLNEAISLAAYQATQSMLATRLPEATVLLADENQAQLGAGSDIGLKVGMEMVVMRFGEKVGRIRVTEVRRGTATAAILESSKGIANMDKAAAIYRLPSGTATGVTYERVAKKQARKSSFTNTILGIVAGAALLAVLGKHTASSQATTGVVSTSLANAFTWFPSQPRGATLTTWGASSNEEDILYYEIYRNEQLMWLKPAAEGRYFIDPPQVRTDTPAGDLLLPMGASIEVDETTGALTDNQVALFEDTGLALPLDFYGVLGNRYLNAWDYTTPLPGLHYVYRVVKLARLRDFESGGGGGGGGGDGGGEPPPDDGGVILSPVAKAAPKAATAKATAVFKLAESRFSDMGGPATAIIPPFALQPDQGVLVADPTQVIFTWAASAGADNYLLQICRTPDFTSTNTQEFLIRVSLPEGEEISQTVDLTRFFPSPIAQSLMWRVGARYSADERPPRLPNDLARSRPQDKDWVWGNTSSLRTGPIGGAAAPQLNQAPAPGSAPVLGAAGPSRDRSWRTR